MKKFALGVIIFSSLSGGMGNAQQVKPTAYSWNGLYLGANGGYGWSQSNVIHSVASPVFVNSSFLSGSSNISNALATLGSTTLLNHLEGVIGGGQVGYNHEVLNNFLMGLDFDIAGLSQSHGSSLANQVLPLVDFPSENYASTVLLRKKIDYLGTVRGRLGFFYKPSLLFYGIGGLAYGGLSLEQSYIASESLGSCIYPMVGAENKHGQTGFGWTLGGGGEWMFTPLWSVKMEYSYYDLGTVNNPVVLRQNYSLNTPPGLWGAAKVQTSSRFAFGTLRLGFNYHFA